MNLKKSTFVICLLMSGLSSPIGFQLQLLPRHKTICFGLIISYVAYYAVRNASSDLTGVDEREVMSILALGALFTQHIWFPELLED